MIKIPDPVINVALSETAPPHYFEEFQHFFAEEGPKVLPGHEIRVSEPKTEELDELLGMMPEVDALVIGGAGQRRPVDKAIIDAGKKLKLIQKLGTRWHQVDVAYARRKGIPVSVEPGLRDANVAEHTFCLMLALARGLFEAHRRVVEGYHEKLGISPKPTSPTQYHYNWTEIRDISCLAGKTLGIIGMGDCGTEVAKRAVGFGMRTIYYTRHPLSEEEEARYRTGAQWVPLEQVFCEADYLSLHASHTPETENMVNRQTLALMKPSAFLVNTARGGLVDEQALYEALVEKRIAGAAADVFKEEPTPKENPLLKLPNFIATPHIAVGSLPIPNRFRGTLENLARVVRGEEPLGVVN